LRLWIQLLVVLIAYLPKVASMNASGLFLTRPHSIRKSLNHPAQNVRRKESGVMEYEAQAMATYNAGSVVIVDIVSPKTAAPGRTPNHYKKVQAGL